MIAPVPGEALVAAVSGQRDGDVAARELADAIGGDRGAVRIRFVVHAGQFVDQIEVVARHVIDPVAGPIACGDQLREPGLVVGGIVEGDRAGIYRLRRHPRHGRHHRARVDTAREERAQRHLGDEPELHGFLEPAVELARGVLERDPAVAGEPHVPIATRLARRFAATDHERVRRRQLSHGTVDGSRLGDIAEREVFLDRERVDRPSRPGCLSSDLISDPNRRCPSGNSA